ncbi:hypothetical protein EDD17DRAFT_727648 [Pisolithus thermaeus]|nr:hypothetical protein EDD17DRAFT_727648 [Pisolithus thermaeus]
MLTMSLDIGILCSANTVSPSSCLPCGGPLYAADSTTLGIVWLTLTRQVSSHSSTFDHSGLNCSISDDDNFTRLATL